jgi:hypothetical protein
VTIPFDITKPEIRRVPVTFNTDETTAEWLQKMMQETGLDRSLIVHRIVKEAKDSASLPEGDKRTGEDRRKTA